MKNDITKELLILEWVTNRLSQREIAEKYDVTLGTIETRIKKYGMTGMRSKIKYPVNTDMLKKDRELFWYLAGLIIADGHIDKSNKRVIISLTDDNEILEEIARSLSTDVKIPVYKYKVKADKYIYTLTLSSSSLVDMLLDLGIDVIKKTEHVHLPDPGNKYLFNFLLRGFIDGDGSLRYKGNSKSAEFRLYIHSYECLASLCVLFKKYYRHDLHVYKRKNKKGHDVESGTLPINTLINIYSCRPELAIDRKRNIIKIEVDDIVHRYGMINRNNW